MSTLSLFGLNCLFDYKLINFSLSSFTQTILSQFLFILNNLITGWCIN